MDTNHEYGYVRVSARDQNENRQLLAMDEFGIPETNVFVEKKSGKDFMRPVYQSLLTQMKPGDTLVIKSVDRLGRNYNEILEQWRYLTKEKQIGIVVLDMPLLDTRQGRDLTGNLIADIVLQLLSYVAQIEREFNHQRQAEGIAAAKAKGVQLGRPRKAKPLIYEDLLEKWRKKEISARQAAKQLGVTHKTFLLWTKEDQE